MKNSALVVIDLQNDITKNYKEIIGKVNEAIDWATQKEMWVVYIQHNILSAGARMFKPGTHGAEMVPELHVVSDHIFTKSKNSALTSETFTAFIKEHGITEFYIAGADAAACIKSTCYNLAKNGYTVHVLSDCITSYDKKKLPELLTYYENKGCTVAALQEIQFMETTMKNTNQLIGCCGLNCETCDTRIATITNDNALRKKTAALWTKLNGVTILPEMIHCTGCRIEGAKTPFCDKLCPVHNCVREKRLDTCADCGQMDGCPTLGRIAANSPFVLENLKQLKQDNA